MPEPERPPVLSVTRFNQLVQATLEGRVPLTWIEGEVSNLVAPPSGHLYFTLKDATSQLRAAMFRNRTRLLASKPRNGMRIRVRGRPSIYMPRGDYQLLVEHIEDAGVGALQQAFDALKLKLAAEGLFAAERKRALPGFPLAIGVVTSASGAVIHDVVTVLARRAPWIPVVLYPTLVQGREAAACIAEAIAVANRRAEVDVLIVGRGGGSLEDLWPFNEEIVARAIAGSALPVISAVGHETDVTIADFVADLRAPTPSAAAESAAPPREELLARVNGELRALNRHMQSRLRDAAAQLALTRKGIIRPDHRLRDHRQQVDELELRARRALADRIALENRRLTEILHRLRMEAPDRKLPEARNRVVALQSRAARALREKLARRQLALEAAAARLNTVSPLATLSRGYAIVLDSAGNVLSTATDTQPGQVVNARLARGELTCRVEAIQPAD
jgi:exodeoxyribonuclease VII large subunit